MNRRSRSPARREKERRHKTKSRKQKKLYLRGMKLNPCLDCGVQYDWWQMHFDHRVPEDKEHEINKLHHQSWATIDHELVKCDAVCANCHADRTHRGKHWLTRRGEFQDHAPDPQRDLFLVKPVA